MLESRSASDEDVARYSMRDDDPRDRGLGDAPQMTKKLLRRIGPRIHTGYLHRPVQSACFRRPILTFPTALGKSTLAHVMTWIGPVSQENLVGRERRADRNCGHNGPRGK